MENKNHFQTKDFYSAVVLKTLGMLLIDLDRSAGRFVTFIFHDPQNKAQQLLADYWNRKTSVIARDLVDSINELKTRMYEKS